MNWTRHGLVAIAVVLFAGVAAWMIMSRFSAPLLKVSEESLDFGDVTSRQLEWCIPITNAGPSDAVISGFDTSCGCVAVKPKELLIKSGEVKNVCFELEFSTVAEQLRESPAFSATVTPILRDYPHVRYLWSIKGAVRSMFSFSQGQFDFSGAAEVYRTERRVAITKVKKLLPQIADIEVELEDDLGTVEVARIDDDDWDFAIKLILKKELEPGVFASQMRITALDDARGLIGVFGFPISGRVVSDIVAVPRHFRLGLHDVGEVVASNLVLNSRIQPFKIVEGGVENGEHHIAYDDQLAATHDVRFTTRILHSGDYTSAIRIVIETTDQRREHLDIPVSYFGAE